jgi:D-glycero-alpha-D-manno-heptose 1-phosphate guanylyltransferase
MTVAVVLAGGFGTRLRAAVSDVPKPMAPVRGKPFLEHLLDYWIDEGVQRFVMSVGYKHELIQSHFGMVYRDVPVQYSVEDKPMGTGGALLYSASDLNQSFLLLNGDTFFTVELEELRVLHEVKKSHYTMCAFESPDLARYTPLYLGENDSIVSLAASNKKEDWLGLMVELP